MDNIRDEPTIDEYNEILKDLDLGPKQPATMGSQAREQRHALNLSQREFAALAGVTFADVSHFENDRSQPGEPGRMMILATMNRLLSESVEALRIELAQLKRDAADRR